MPAEDGWLAGQKVTVVALIIRHQSFHDSHKLQQIRSKTHLHTMSTEKTFTGEKCYCTQFMQKAYDCSKVGQEKVLHELTFKQKKRRRKKTTQYKWVHLTENSITV